MNGQQLLDLFNHEFEFNDFFASGNEISVANLQNFSSQYSHIYGAHLTGKTHLLKAWVNLANRRHQNALYLEATNLAEVSLSQLDLERYRFIAIDDIELLSEDNQIELFDLFNHIKLNNRSNYLLTSSGVKLNQTELRVDLKTRILSGLVFALKNLNESELLTALAIYAKREGIKVGDSELKYLLSHYPRNLGQLIDYLNQISQVALALKKTITIPFIKQVIATIDGGN